MISHHFTRAGYPEDAYGGRVCNVKLNVTGDCSRVGEVSYALRELPGLCIKLQDNDINVTVNCTADIHNTTDTDTTETDDQHTSDDVNSPIQQACPYTFSDFDNDTQSTTHNEDTPQSDLDKTPLLDRSQLQLDCDTVRTNKKRRKLSVDPDETPSLPTPPLLKRYRVVVDLDRTPPLPRPPLMVDLDRTPTLPTQPHTDKDKSHDQNSSTPKRKHSQLHSRLLDSQYKNR